MNSSVMPEDLVLLPTTVLGLEGFIQDIIDEFELPTGDDTADAICTMIMHLPHTQAYAPRKHFGHGVLKSLANRVAYDKLVELKATEGEQVAEPIQDATVQTPV